MIYFLGHIAKFGTYGRKAVLELENHMKTTANVTNKSVLVLGSLNPWIEILALSLGAKKVVSVGYSHLKNECHKIEYIYAPNFFKMEHFISSFDVVITTTLFQEIGLGLSGENLNPWMDLISMQRIWCLTKPGGKFIFSTILHNKDQVTYNFYRLYGPKRYKKLISNWKVLFSNVEFNPVFEKKSDGYQPLTILEK